MGTLNKPWHIRIGLYGRAYFKPHGLWQRFILLTRGWQPHMYGWWSKMSYNQAKLEKRCHL